MEKLKQTIQTNFINKDNIRKEIAPMLKEKKKNKKILWIILAAILIAILAFCFSIKM